MHLSHHAQCDGGPADSGPPPLRMVFWESTAACNLACRHCRRLEASEALSRLDLTGDQAREMICQIAQVGRPILVFSGGEPLMRPDVFELGGCARAAGLTVALATNGTQVDGPTARRIQDAGFSRVAVSLDGPDEATHNRLRQQPGSFAAACRGVRHLRAAGLSVQINCTVTVHNASRLDALYDLAAELDADALHLFMLVPVGCGASLDESEMLSADRCEEALNWLYDRSRIGPLSVRATCAPQYYRIIRQRESARPTGPSASVSATGRGCLAGQAVCFISHAGQVFPCGYLPVQAGHILESDLATIWRDSPVFARLRDPSQLTGKCGRCDYVDVCMGCRARAFTATGDYMGPEPYCAYVPRHPSKRYS